MVGARIRKQFSPGGDIGPSPQKSSAFPFGHTSPDSEFDSVVKGVSEAFGTNGASEASGLDAILGGTLNEEIVRVQITAGRVRGPVAIDGRADQLGRAGTSCGAGAGSQAAGHATCLSSRVRVRGPVRVVTWLRPKPYGAPLPRHRPHTGGCPNDPSGPLIRVINVVRSVTASCRPRDIHVSEERGHRLVPIARPSGREGGHLEVPGRDSDDRNIPSASGTSGRFWSFRRHRTHRTRRHPAARETPVLPAACPDSG